MEEKEQVQAYISLYKQQMERYGRTQDIEWKGNFGVWALLAGASYLAAKETVTLSRLTTGTVLLLTVIVHFGWLLNIHNSERFDKRLWVEYRRWALDIIRPGHGEEPFRHSWLKEFVWILLEVGMTTILSLVLFALLFWRAN
jgi:hypothetical protein